MRKTIYIEPVDLTVEEDRREMRKIYRQMKPKRPLPLPEAWPDALMVRLGARGIPLEVWAGYADENGHIRREDWIGIYRRFPPRSNNEARSDTAGLAGDPVLRDVGVPA